MKLKMKLAIALTIALIPLLARASTQGDLLKWGIWTDGKNVSIPKGNLTVPVGDLAVTAGDVNIPAGDINMTTGSMNLALGDLVIKSGDLVTSSTCHPVSSVSVTSPTKTVDVTGRKFIRVTTNVAQTGFLPSGGSAGKEVTFMGTSDTNTVRFDDNGSTMALGANITLGVDDTLTLLQYQTGKWVRTGSTDN